MLTPTGSPNSVLKPIVRLGFHLGVDWLSAPILSILPIIDIGHFKNRYADIFFFLCKQTYYLQVTFIYWWINNTGEII